MPPTPDYYARLGVPASASAEQVKAAYLRLVFQWHPDRNPSAEATRRTAEINAAWEVLGDAEKRAAYDRRLGRRRPTPARGPATTPTAGARSRAASRPARSAPPAPDPAAAERARREAEARAREAEERRRREAEYERRREASAHLWEPPPESGLGWADRDFVVGHWYRNNIGPFRVIDVKDRWVEIYYPDGNIVSMRRDELWNHWRGRVSGRGGRSRVSRR